MSQLQTKLAQYPQALHSVDTAIDSAPWRVDLYEQRRSIEKAAGFDHNLIDLHFAQRLRARADFAVRTGDSHLAVQTYLSAFEEVSSIVDMDDDVSYELQTIIRTLSAVLSTDGRQEDAEQFWQTLAQDPLLSAAQQQLATQEANRLSHKH